MTELGDEVHVDFILYCAVCFRSAIVRDTELAEK